MATVTTVALTVNDWRLVNRFWLIRGLFLMTEISCNICYVRLHLCINYGACDLCKILLQSCQRRWLDSSFFRGLLTKFRSANLIIDDDKVVRIDFLGRTGLATFLGFAVAVAANHEHFAVFLLLYASKCFYGLIVALGLALTFELRL